jgi:hypothetical protein
MVLTPEGLLDTRGGRRSDPLVNRQGAVQRRCGVVTLVVLEKEKPDLNIPRLAGGRGRVPWKALSLDLPP